MVCRGRLLMPLSELYWPWWLPWQLFTGPACQISFPVNYQKNETFERTKRVQVVDEE